MTRKYWMALLLGAAMTMTAVPAVYAEETEAVTEAAQETPEKCPAYQAMDYVTLGEYKGLTIEIDPLTVTDDEVDEVVAERIQQSGELEDIIEGAVQNGDIANIDYEGKKDGVAFAGGTAAGFDLTIGSHMFIGGFEEGLIGVNVGDTVDLDLTFPENYGSAELAGQAVVFTVTVNSIQRAPELTDDLVKKITNEEFADVDSFREDLKNELLEYKTQNQEGEINSKIFTLVANNCDIVSFPEDVVNYRIKVEKDFYKEMAEYYQMSFEEFLSAYLGATEEQFDNAVLMQVQQVLAQEMYLNAVAENEGIALTEEEYKNGTDDLAAQYGYESGEAMEEVYGEESLRSSVLQSKVMDMLRENTTILTAGEGESEAETE